MGWIRMTKKRFTIDVENYNYENAIFFDEKFICYEDDYDAILQLLNKQQQKIEELEEKLKQNKKKLKPDKKSQYILESTKSVVMMTENKRLICSNYLKWLYNWQQDMKKHYSDKRRVIKRRICND